MDDTLPTLCQHSLTLWLFLCRLRFFGPFGCWELLVRHGGQLLSLAGYLGFQRRELVLHLLLVLV